MAEIKGKINFIKYQNPETGFVIGSLKLEEEASIMEADGQPGELLNIGKSIVFKGIVHGAKKAGKATFKGYWINDPKWGLQFSVVKNIFVKESITEDQGAAIIKSFVMTRVKSGDTYAKEEELLDYLREEYDMGEEEALRQINSLIDQADGIHCELLQGMSVIYLKSLYEAEEETCKALERLVKGDVDKITEKTALDFSPLEKKMGVTLSKDQKEAVRGALSHGVSVITGGPGTGKTTIIRALYRALRTMGNSVEIAAPTGRAAKRIKESTGYNAMTIHRLLEATLDEKRNLVVFGRTEKEPLECDGIVIDEASMIDINLMNSLLKAMKTGTRLVLVGDYNQLPPVGPGNVLRDIIESEYIHRVDLKEIFRQAKESKIITAAHEINKGEYPSLDYKEDDDLAFFEKETYNEVLEEIVKLDSFRDSQVIAPTKNGPLGIDNLNKILQEHINPPGEWKNEYKREDGTILREGDQVMQIKNQYSRAWKKAHSEIEGAGLFNGDMGIIQEIDNICEKVKVIFDEEKISDYSYEDLGEIQLSYAITVHKSQGSEFDNVIMPITMVGKLLGTRNLLYTAVTRAKKNAILLGNKKALYYMIDNKDNIMRNSGLKFRLMKLMEEEESIV